MSDPEIRLKRFKKRNEIAKHLRDTGDHKGAYALKVIDSRKQQYKRQKLRVYDIYEEEE